MNVYPKMYWKEKEQTATCFMNWVPLHMLNFSQLCTLVLPHKTISNRFKHTIVSAHSTLWPHSLHTTILYSIRKYSSLFTIRTCLLYLHNYDRVFRYYSTRNTCSVTFTVD